MQRANRATFTATLMIGWLLTAPPVQAAEATMRYEPWLFAMAIGILSAGLVRLYALLCLILVTITLAGAISANLGVVLPFRDLLSALIAAAIGLVLVFGICMPSQLLMGLLCAGAAAYGYAQPEMILGGSDVSPAPLLVRLVAYSAVAIPCALMVRWLDSLPARLLHQRERRGVSVLTGSLVIWVSLVL